MTDKLKYRIKQHGGFENATEEAILNLLAAADYVRAEIEAICAKYGITGPQYNILRILRGAPPKGHRHGDICERLVERRAPDVTRLIDKLIEKGLVQRQRSTEDRRVVLHRITGAGEELLSEIIPELEEMSAGLTEGTSEAALRQFIEVCEGFYAGTPGANADAKNSDGSA